MNYYTPARVDVAAPGERRSSTAAAMPRSRRFPGVADFRFTPRYPRTDIDWEIDPARARGAAGGDPPAHAACRWWSPRTARRSPTEPRCADGTVDDADRIDYLRTHLAAIERGPRGRAPTCATYVLWTLMDNFEWSHGYTKHFGLVSVDRSDLQPYARSGPTAGSRELVRRTGSVSRPRRRRVPCSRGAEDAQPMSGIKDVAREAGRLHRHGLARPAWAAAGLRGDPRAGARRGRADGVRRLAAGREPGQRADPHGRRRRTQRDAVVLRLGRSTGRRSCCASEGYDVLLYNITGDPTAAAPAVLHPPAEQAGRRRDGAGAAADPGGDRLARPRSGPRPSWSAARCPSWPSVRIDDVLAATTAVQHLIDLGHERIAHLGGTPDPEHAGLEFPTPGRPAAPATGRRWPRPGCRSTPPGR